MLATFYLSLSYCMLIYIWILECFDSPSLKADPNEIDDYKIPASLIN